MSYFKNWKCYSYRFQGIKKNYSYQELKEHFNIDGSEVIYCKKDFFNYQQGNYYLLSNGEWFGCGFVVNSHPYKSWTDKEYLKAM